MKKYRIIYSGDDEYPYKVQRKISLFWLTNASWRSMAAAEQSIRLLMTPSLKGKDFIQKPK